ncbi:MAG: DUF1127 domain-containing protein [Pseudomonadota bacterium]
MSNIALNGVADRAAAPSIDPSIDPTFGLWTAIRRRSARIRTAEQLNALTDAQLRDIGVERGEIEDIARNAAAENAEGK